MQQPWQSLPELNEPSRRHHCHARLAPTEAVVIDTSASALELASAAAKKNGVAERVQIHKADVFLDLVSRADADERFDIVVADPPSFVKSKRDLKSGSRGYRKLAWLAAKVVAPGGVLFIASCSHNVSIDLFNEQVVRGEADARRTGRILMKSGASPDHPLDPGLPVDPADESGDVLR